MSTGLSQNCNAIFSKFITFKESDFSINFIITKL